MNGESSKRRKQSKVSANMQQDMEPDNENYKPSRLFKICINFISENIHLVDSLIDFPEIIGKELFFSCCDSSTFSSLNQRSLTAMELFSFAYGSLVLHEINLSGQHLAMGRYLNFFTAFRELEKVDLSHCLLGDDHDMVIHLGQLQRITHLNLRNNALTDMGLQKMTASLRVYKSRGPMLLQWLNLSSNPGITNESARYFMILHNLKFLNLSGSKFTKTGLSKLKSSSLALHPTSDDKNESEHWGNEGWAAQVVTDWLEEIKNTRKEPPALKKSIVECTGQLSSFYRGKKKNKKVLPVPFSSDTIDNPRIILIAKNSTVPHNKSSQDAECVDLRKESKKSTKLKKTAHRNVIGMSECEKTKEDSLTSVGLEIMKGYI